jgi:chloramphenicol 3-O-phosphotransferase
MIVCLLGRSGAGKSTLAKRLQELCPESFARVPVDFFFVPRPVGVGIADYLSQPIAYDTRGRAVHAGL